MKRIRREPVLVYGFAQACIGLATAFGAHLSGEQIASILAVTGSMLALICRNFTTPTEQP